jgi:hypothetical protein
VKSCTHEEKKKGVLLGKPPGKHWSRVSFSADCFVLEQVWVLLGGVRGETCVQISF